VRSLLDLLAKKNDIISKLSVEIADLKGANAKRCPKGTIMAKCKGFVPEEYQREGYQSVYCDKCRDAQIQADYFWHCDCCGYDICWRC